MDLQKKIEEIRRRPESERWKYVWGCVAFSMLLVLTLWILSMRSSVQRFPDQSLERTLRALPLPGASEQTSETPVSDAPSLDEWLKQGKSESEAVQDR